MRIGTTRLLQVPPPRMLTLPMKMNRRSFMQGSLTAAAAAGATWFDVPSLLAAKAKPSKAVAASLKKYGGFPMGIQSYSLRAFGVEGDGNALDKIGALGLHWVEFFGGHFPSSANRRQWYGNTTIR